MDEWISRLLDGWRWSRRSFDFLTLHLGVTYLLTQPLRLSTIIHHPLSILAPAVGELLLRRLGRQSHLRDVRLLQKVQHSNDALIVHFGRALHDDAGLRITGFQRKQALF